MSSLRMSFCVKAATDLNDADLDAITDAIEAAVGDGTSAAVAERMAVDDQLAAVQLERRELVKLIQAQLGDRLKPAKAKGKASSTAAKSGLEDVGENLAFNRRNFTGRGLTWADLQGMNETLRVKNAVKAKVWPRPDYEALIADGMQPTLARLVKQVYDGLSAGPTVRVGSPTEADLERYVATIGKVRDATMALVQDPEFVAALNRPFTNRDNSVLGSIQRDREFKPTMEALLRRTWPEEYQGAMRPFANGTTAANELRVIGGNKAARSMQFAREDVAEWSRDVTINGWPAKREAWEVQGYKVYAPGEWTSEAVPASASLTTPYWRVSVGRKSWRQATEPDTSQFLLALTDGSFNQLHPSREAAVEAARAKVAKKKDAIKVAQGTNLGETTRQGVARREPGENITAERLMQTFGFRGVNFGGKGWMGEAERQAFLNAAFDGFHDLAEIMGVPPKAMSLGGQLGVAFGAQGKGGNAAAHFVPGLNEINLTKTMGAGALAHEFGHALDHWFAVQAGLGSNAEPWLSSHPSRPAMVPRMVQEGGKWTRREEPGYADTIRPEVVEAFRQVVKAMDKRDAAPEDLAAQREATIARAKKNLDGWLKRARSAMQPERADPQLLAEFDRLAEAIKAFDLGDGYVKAGQKMFAPRVAELRDVVRRASGRLLSLEDTEGIENTARHAIYMMQSENFERTHSPQRSTKYAADSHAMDKHKGGKAYWGTAWEKFARAFETWVHDRLVERGALNTFLSNADERSQSPVTIPDESSAMARGSGATRDLYLWPTGEERQAMSKAFSALVDGLKVREDDDGNVTLYSRGQAGMGSRPAAVQAAVDRLTANWTNAPEVEVLGSMADAPKAVRDHDAKMRSQGATGEPEGFFYKGKVYLNASMLGDQAAVERVLFHETLGHFGLRGAFGPELDSVLRQVVAGRRSEVEAKRKAYGLPDTDAGRLVAAEEVLAELAQTKPELGLVKRALAAIRAVLRKLGLGGRMSDAELVREFIEPARAFVERGGKPQDFTDTEPMVRQLFSRVTRSKAFKRWFGDSKVVDAEGKPLVVYHGTGADFAEFDPSSYARNFTGDYGVGFYFTQDAKKAGQYADGAAGKGGAPNVMPVYLALKNPAIVSAAFGDGDLWRMVPGAKSREELTAGLIAQGYDGVIVDGGRAGVLYVKEAVAFRPEQIKSATGNSGAFDAANPDIRFSRDGRLERREVQRDFDGSPWLEGDGLDLVAPKEVLRPEVIADEGESLLRFQIMASGSAKSVGFVELLMRDGRPVALLDIEVKPEGRKNGTGRRAVEAALAAADGDLEISNIVTAARGFWEKLGVPEQNLPDGYAYQGVLNAETYRQGPGADAQGVRGAAGQAAREGAPGVGQPRGAGAPESLGGEEPGADEGLDETLFSRAPSRQAFADFMEAAKDRTSTSRFNGLHKSLATQLHKAWVDKDFAKVFQRAQDFERDVARAATRPAEAAPDLLPTFDNLRSAWHRLVHGDKDAERVRQVGAAVWAGTLEGGPEPHTGKVWSKAELLEKFNLDDQQVELYRQARAAIDASLDESAAALAFEMVKEYAPGLRDAIRTTPSDAREILEAKMDGIQAMGKDASKALAQAMAVLDRADELKAGGYAPLMRFGKYAVSVSDENGELLHFEKHETELQAKAAAIKLRREYPGATVERSTMDTEGFKLFAGVDPESVALFAKQLKGHIQDDALQQWYRNAVSERSAMKRMIGPRKGMAGFNQELRRVLASFITSNARLAARQLNMGDMTAEIQAMRERRVAGDVVDEAVKLKEYLENPDEPFKGLRSLMFTWYLGGSVASAAVNATQPLMMTLPYLSQFGNASKALLGAVKEAMTGKVADTRLADALARAAEDGKVDPQEVHHLYHEGMPGLIDRLPGGQDLKARAQGAATLWGYMFGAVENFNRRLTFIAAYRMAQAKPELGDPYSFAIRAIDETQGIYGKSNRPNWARGTGSFGAVGVAAFTFKQYSIGYVELLVRLAKSGPKGKMAVMGMLGLLLLASGLQGLPGAEDLEDLVDTVAQRLGYRGNSRAALRETLHDTLGVTVGDLVMYGAGTLTPADIQGRLSMGNLLPATGILMPTNRDRKSQQLAELVGPMGGFASQVGDALDAKDTGAVMGSFAPLAVKNALMGIQMADTGEYRDVRDRKVTDVDGADALLKAIGFQPTSVASVRRPERMVAQDITRVRQVESDLVELRAQAMVENDPELRREADELLRQWREKNPELNIVINQAQVLRRVKEMRRSSRDRLIDTAPRETRRALEAQLEE